MPEQRNQRHRRRCVSFAIWCDAIRRCGCVRPQPKFTPSRALVEATYQLLVADKAMVGLLLAGGFAAAAVLALVMYPAWPFGHIAPSVSGGGLAGLLVLTGGLWASSLVIRFVTGAVVGAAVIRADGRSPSVRAALAVAWSRRWQLAAWALVSAVIAVLLGKLQRFGIAGWPPGSSRGSAGRRRRCSRCRW